jgi:SEC-C motif
MAKTGRNQPCPCGSGKKYKHCHGSIRADPPRSAGLTHNFDEQLARAKRRAEAQRKQREKQQGLGRPIVSAELAGHRIIAVGNTVHTSKRWKTFHDFLRQYLIGQLSVDWFKAEHAKPLDQRHLIVRWHDQAIAVAQRNSTKIGEIYWGPMTGAQRAFLNLAYNIYLIAHHAEPQGAKALLATFIERLKSERSDDFVGKLFETYAAAAFLKAGFKLAYEDETDPGTSHVEFVATYPATGKKFSVEVKARNRAATEDGPVDDIRRLRVASKLNRALAKKADYTRVVMIEVNVPDVIKEQAFDGWPKAALAQIRQAEKSLAPDGSDKPSAYAIVTNHAFHNNLEAVDVGAQVLAAGCRISDFGPDAMFNSLKAVLESEQRHQEIFALADSMRNHYEIPSTFNGENPELAFQPETDAPLLRLGESYVVPTLDGEEVLGRLMDAVVDENKKTAVGVYQTDTGDFMVTHPLTDAEFAAWKRHPETFFGEIRQHSRKAENWLELAKFFYETYQHTPRDKLLEWIKGAPDYEDLCKLSQKDLAVAYCERIALTAEAESRRNPPESAGRHSGTY